MKNLLNDKYFMGEALKEAQKAFEIDEVPVGAVVVIKNKIIARAHNLTQRLNDATAHAEMQAITSASNYLNSKYLKGCTIYVTLEPCVMCAGALYWSKIEKLIYSSCDIMKGFSQAGNLLHPKTIVKKGEYEKETTDLLNKFFRNKRK
jgi:tRNA(adenine34) deaminase